MSLIPKSYICENLTLPESTFVLHIFYPKFMIDLVDEKIIWLEDDLLQDVIKYQFKDILSEAIDWAIEETDKLNSMREIDISTIKKETNFEFIKKFN